METQKLINGFGDDLIIQEVYQGKQNQVKSKKKKKVKSDVIPINEEDFKRYLLAKEYIYIENGQSYYNYPKLIKTIKNKVVNMNVKDIQKEYSANLKVLTKYRYFENRLKKLKII